MFRDLGRATYEQDAHKIRPLVVERSRLTRNVAAAATTVFINSLPRGVDTNQGWVVVDPFTNECEARKITGRAGKVLTLSSALAYGHSRYDEVLFLDAPILNVNWWGCLGNDSTDNTTNINRAMANSFLLGGTLRIPEGTYLIDALATTSGAAGQHLRIIGDGDKSILKLKNSASGTIMLHVHTIGSFQLENLTIDGNKANNTGYLLGVRTDVADSVIRNVKFLNTEKEGLFHTAGSAAQVARFIVEGCRFVGCGGFGCCAEQVIEMVFSNNIADGCGYGLVDIEPFHAGDTSAYITITGNVCYNTGSDLEAAGAIQVYCKESTSGNASTRFTTIANNVVHICGGHGIRISNTREVTVTGNIVSYANRNGIWVDGDTANGGSESSHVTITGNVIKSCSAGTANVYSGINCSEISESVIIGNVIADVNSKHRYHLYLGTATSRNVFGANSLGAAAAQTANLFSGNTSNVFLPMAFNAQAFTGGDTTPSVCGGQFYTCTNGSAVTITNFDDGIDGQSVTVMFTDANTTIVSGTAFRLAAGTAFTSSANDTLSVVKSGTIWYERGRSVN